MDRSNCIGERDRLLKVINEKPIMRKQLIGSLFAFAMAGQLWGQGLYEKYERMLTLPEGYVCYRVDGKLK